MQEQVDIISMRIYGKEEHMEGRGIEDRNGKRGTQLKGTFEQVRLQLKLQVTTGVNGWENKEN
jgi:hypothetical protein